LSRISVLVPVLHARRIARRKRAREPERRRAGGCVGEDVADHVRGARIDDLHCGSGRCTADTMIVE
jgi:hypothetical protein